jgi:hypothetical protein
MGDGVYYEYYPYHDGPGASSSLAPMLVLALLFIGMLLLFSWAAYVDSRTFRGVVTIQDATARRVGGGGQNVYAPRPPSLNPEGGQLDPPSAPPQPPEMRYGACARPVLRASPNAVQVPVSQPIGAVLSPPWGRGAPVSGNDVRAAMMSSASVSGFFKTL